MRILVLSWEFPPRIVGGIARHVAELYPELVKLGFDVHLITITFDNAPLFEVVEGIKVHRVSVNSADHFFDWVNNMNTNMSNHAFKLIESEGKFDLIHAHDWLVGDAAIAIKHNFKTPLITTIHATENGRNNGIYNSDQHYIDHKENILIYNAWRIIVCSNYMKQEIERTFFCPPDKIDVIYNGIRAEKKHRPAEFHYRDFRHRFAKDDEKIVYYVGRITFEKGIQVLINAIPKVLKTMNNQVKLIIIGGGNIIHLKQQASNLGIIDKCCFTGFMSEEDLNKFQTVADCAVFPSLYEPFGIVALESFASRVPVVVSDAGGLPEVVQHGITGIVTSRGNADSLAWGIMEVLNNSDYSQSLIKNAYQDLALRFDWSKLAQQTAAVYQRVMEEKQDVIWE